MSPWNRDDLMVWLFSIFAEGIKLEIYQSVTCFGFSFFNI